MEVQMINEDINSTLPSGEIHIESHIPIKPNKAYHIYNGNLNYVDSLIPGQKHVLIKPKSENGAILRRKLVNKKVSGLETKVPVSFGDLHVKYNIGVDDVPLSEGLKNNYWSGISSFHDYFQRLSNAEESNSRLIQEDLSLDQIILSPGGVYVLSSTADIKNNMSLDEIKAQRNLQFIYSALANMKDSKLARRLVDTYLDTLPVKEVRNASLANKTRIPNLVLYASSTKNSSSYMQNSNLVDSKLNTILRQYSN